MRVCSYCVATRGIKGSDLIKNGERDLDDNEKFAQHIEDEHNIPVQRKNEANKQTMERFYREHPDAKDPATCKCLECKAKRSDSREMLVSVLRSKR